MEEKLIQVMIDHYRALLFRGLSQIEKEVPSCDYKAISKAFEHLDASLQRDAKLFEVL